MKAYWFTLMMATHTVAVAAAEAAQSEVLLTIVAASASRSQPFIIRTQAGDLLTNCVAFRCSAVIENQTGRSLAVTSSFISAFDGLHLTVFDESNRQLARQSFVHHQSPYSIQGRAFSLPPGRTTNELGFPILAIPETSRNLKLRLDGGLPGSAYTASLTSNVVNVRVERTRDR